MPLFGFDPQSVLYGATPVDNMFIHEIMPDMDGGVVKAYLYGLMRSYHPSSSDAAETLQSAARHLGMDEPQLYNAYALLEEKGLARRVSDNPPAYVFINASLMLKQKPDDGFSMFRYQEFHNRLGMIFGSDRLLRPKDYETVNAWRERLAMSDEVALKLVEFGVLKYGKNVDLKKLDKQASLWRDAGVKTAHDADNEIRLLKAEERGLKQVIYRLRRRSDPSVDEAELFLKWTEEWGFTLQAVLAACAETTKGFHSMAYLDGILKRQHALGKHDAPELIAQIGGERAEDEKIRAVMSAAGIRGASPTPEWKNFYNGMQAKGFSHGSIELAAGQASRHGGKLDTIERLMTSWLDRGLVDENAIEAHLTVVQAANMRLGRLLRVAGSDRTPTARDRAALESWRADGFADELMDVAAEFAQGKESPVAYMDKLLREWRSHGAQSIEAARAEHAAYLARMAAGGTPDTPRAPPQQRSSKEVAEHRYGQRAYSDGQLSSLAVDVFAEDDA